MQERQLSKKEETSQSNIESSILQDFAHSATLRRFGRPCIFPVKNNTVKYRMQDVNIKAREEEKVGDRASRTITRACFDRELKAEMT